MQVGDVSGGGGPVFGESMRDPAQCTTHNLKSISFRAIRASRARECVCRRVRCRSAGGRGPLRGLRRAVCTRTRKSNCRICDVKSCPPVDVPRVSIDKVCGSYLVCRP